MNQIIIELCAEDRARLDKIAALLEAGIEAQLRTPKTTTETPQKLTKEEEQGNTQPEAETQEPPQKTEPESVEDRAGLDKIVALLEAGSKAQPRTPQKTEPEKVDVGVEDIRRLVVTLSANGKKDEAREVVQTYAKTVSDLPADKYAEVWTKLKELEV